MDLDALEKLNADMKKMTRSTDDFLRTQKKKCSGIGSKDKRSSVTSTDQKQLSNTKDKKVKETNFYPFKPRKRESLSNALQWHLPDLMKKPIPDGDIVKLGRFLHYPKKLSDKQCFPEDKQKVMLKILLDIKNSGYETMEKCLCIFEGSNRDAVESIRRLCKRYQDLGFGSNSKVCGFCRVRTSVNINYFSGCLLKHGIISDDFIDKIVASDRDKESERMLWNTLEAELKNYDTRQHLMEALAETLANSTDTGCDSVGKIKVWMKDPTSKFKCNCQQMYLDIPRSDIKTESETESDNVFSEREKKEEERICNDDRSKSKSRSTSGTRRKLLKTDSKDRKSRCKTSSTKMPNTGKELVQKQTAMRDNKPDSVRKMTAHTTVDRKTFQFNNTGPVYVGNKFTKFGNMQLSDSSNDTESFTPYDSESDMNSIILSKKQEVDENLSVSKEVEPTCKQQNIYGLRCEIKTSRRRRTVSESALLNSSNNKLEYHNLDKLKSFKMERKYEERTETYSESTDRTLNQQDFEEDSENLAANKVDGNEISEKSETITVDNAGEGNEKQKRTTFFFTKEKLKFDQILTQLSPATVLCSVSETANDRMETPMEVDTCMKTNTEKSKTEHDSSILNDTDYETASSGDDNHE